MELSDLQRIEIKKYRDNGDSLADISRRTEIDYSTLYREVRLPERGYGSAPEYLAYLMNYNSKRAPNRTLARLISDQLREFGWTGAELAKRVGTTTATISRAKNGKTIPKPEVLRRIFVALALPYNDARGMMADNPPKDLTK